MYTVTSLHVVLVRGIDEQVGIGAGIHAGFHERERVLRHAGIVVVIVNDEQVSLQVSGFSDCIAGNLPDCFAGYPCSVRRT